MDSIVHVSATHFKVGRPAALPCAATAGVTFRLLVGRESHLVRLALEACGSGSAGLRRVLGAMVSGGVSENTAATAAA